MIGHITASACRSLHTGILLMCARESELARLQVVVRPVQYDGPRDMQWLLKIVFGIGPAMGTIEASRLIHPYSLFSQCIAVCSV